MTGATTSTIWPHPASEEEAPRLELRGTGGGSSESAEAAGE